MEKQPCRVDWLTDVRSCGASLALGPLPLAAYLPLDRRCMDRDAYRPRLRLADANKPIGLFSASRIGTFGLVHGDARMPPDTWTAAASAST